MSTRTILSALVLTSLLGACAGDDDASAGSSSRRAPSAQPVMGSFELPDTSFAFRVIRCDLTGTAPDGMLLRGAGYMPDGSQLLPDGRAMTVEVERLTPDLGGPPWINERATVRFGSRMEEDGWEATAMSRDGSAWTGEDMMPLEGPIIQVSGNDLLVEATYGHASTAEELEGTLRATCPAQVYP